MGTDIHMVTEKTIGDDWLGVNCFPNLWMTDRSDAYPMAIRRNYNLFAALAGVRGAGPAPRGLPDNASALTNLCLQACDGYSHSWLAVVEAIPLFVEHVSPLSTYPGLLHEDAITDYAIYMFGAVGAEYNTLSHWRIVFWFDS